MFGVLVIVLGRYPIAGLEFSECNRFAVGNFVNAHVGGIEGKLDVFRME